MLKLTDGVDDAAVSVRSTIQGGQGFDGPLSQTVLWEEITRITNKLLFIVSHDTVAHLNFSNITGEHSRD